MNMPVCYTLRFSRNSVRVDKIHSRLHVDGASITNDRRTLCLRRRSPGAATERQQTVGGRRPPGRIGQISVSVSSAGALCPVQKYFYSASALLAMQSAVPARAILSVRPSVCHSVTFRCFVQTNDDTIVRFSAPGRTIALVSGEVKFIRIFAGITSSGGVKVKHPLSLAKI